MNGINDIANNEILKDIMFVCSCYNINAKIVDCSVGVPLEKRGVYLIASHHDISNDCNPIDILNRNNRNSELIYLDIFSIQLQESTAFIKKEEIINYCQNVELVKACVSEFYKKDIPDVITRKDFITLVNLRKKIENYKYSEKERQQFFKEYKKLVGVVVRRKFKENKNVVNIQSLINNSANLCVTEVAEDVYQEFKDLIAKYPEVKYAISDVDKVNYNVAVDNFLSKKDDLYYLRKIVYRKQDSQLVLQTLNQVTFKFASKLSVEDLQANDAVVFVKIPKQQLNNFNSLAKANDLKYAIDDGRFTTLKRDEITVFTQKRDLPKLKGIVDKILLEKAMKHTSFISKKQHIDSFEL